ncbi:S-adenosyl methyltransferase [Actinopolyspora alba]|uniref:S-adenosyl methyltransferase n=1 Tax=Actinopolyspora alba TaxID=673379 RepID=A0A1I1UG61_9ACTN|nr:SAM-dependent methyltransferase [Actinopolyspora alba]SFD69707.1 S-adenosyl methyltransferase [Actinopolyspora alba]
MNQHEDPRESVPFSSFAPPPGETRTDRPNAARMYDYYLGGSTNFAVDREAAEAGSAAMPHAREYARANRAFLGRAVAYLSARGIDQFLDLGSGIPTVGNVHEVAQSLDPTARVAYVDHEPVAVAHAQRLLAEHSNVTITLADVRDPQAVLTAPGVAGLLDFSRPVGVLAVAVLPFVPEQRAAREVITAYREACVAGSYLVLSHISAISATERQVADAEEIMARTPTPVRWRPPHEITELMEGYELVEPGLVPLPSWHPQDTVAREEIEVSNAYGAVGRLTR